MTQSTLLTIDGLVAKPLALDLDALTAIDAGHQVLDASQLDPARKGQAVALAGLLGAAGAMPEADYLTLHASADDFHASIPLAEVRDRAFVVYQIDDRPLTASEGGPLRLFIRDVAACHADAIDECANVKFLDRIELTRGKGFDNRPQDDESHEALHRRQSEEEPGE